MKSKDIYHKIINGKCVAINLPEPKTLTKKEQKDLEKTQQLFKALVKNLI